MAVLFAILALAAGIVGTVLTGWIGFGISVLLAVIAIAIRVNKNKNEDRPRHGSIVLAVIAIIAGILTQVVMMSLADGIKTDAEELGDVPYVVAVAEGMKKFGIIGFANSAAEKKPADMSDDAFADELKRQMDRVTKSIEKKNGR